MAALRALVLLGTVLSVAACGSSASQTTADGGSPGAAGATASEAGSGVGGASMGAAAGSAAFGGSAGGSGAVGGAASGAVGGSSSGGSAGTGGVAATLPTCGPPADVFSPIEKLSLTGCVDPADPRKPTPKAVPYEVNSPLWSDSADKTRAFILPVGTKIQVRSCKAGATGCDPADDGRWDFPVATVMYKTFSFNSKLVETRLFIHLDADNWVGYSYQWNEAQTDATIVDSGGADATFDFGAPAPAVSWHYPSRDDCMNCHNHAGGSTLGPETAQMNRVVGGMNQIDAMAAKGLFATPPSMPYKPALVAPYATSLGAPSAGVTTEQKARSYLHANCGFCHRPGGNFANFDLRYDTSLKNMGVCKTDVKKGAIAAAPMKTTLLEPGKSMDSVLWLRMNEVDPNKGRMPQIASFKVDMDATRVVGDWINALGNSCP